MPTFNLTPPDLAASIVTVEQEAVNRRAGVGAFLHRVLIPAQVNTGETPEFDKPVRVRTVADAIAIGGRGSMAALLASDALARGRNVYLMPIEDAETGVAAEGSITVTQAPSADGTIALGIGGDRVLVAVESGDTANDVATKIAAAITAQPDLPVSASADTETVTVTVKWDGESGNQILLEANPRDDDELPAGLTLTVTDIGEETAGDNDPSLEDALGGIGQTWYAELVCPYLSQDRINECIAWAEARNEPTKKRQVLVMVGFTDVHSEYIGDNKFLDDYNSEWLAVIPVHGSSTPAMRIAAGAAGEWSEWQSANRARPIKGRIIPGALAADDNDLDNEDWDDSVKEGGSWTRNLPDGRVVFGDVVTTRTETDQGVPTTDWRYAIIVPNLQFKIHALEITLMDSPFDQAVVIADGGPPGPTWAVRPKTVKAYLIQLVDQWVAFGLSTDRDAIVGEMSVEIDGDNPGRINALVPDRPSAGLRILASKLDWDFFVGGNS